MAQAKLIDGRAIAEALRQRIATTVHHTQSQHGVTPGLAAILVGDNPASEIYVRNKRRATEAAGMRSFEHRLDHDASETDLLSLIEALNADDRVDGILVQLPLPSQINASSVLERVDPGKDVDGFHPLNAGRLATGREALVACTPLGCIILAKSVMPDLSGMEAVIIGRSNIVGKPLAQLLLAENATVTIAHSRSQDLPSITRRADIVFAAAGRPEMVKADWIKPGAIVIDVGINRVPAPEKGEGRTKLVGDVAFDEVRNVASAITPVPGGVGPMTIACLLANTLKAALMRRGLNPGNLETGL